MVTFTKLLEMRIVASNVSESFSNDLMYLSEVWLSSSISFKSLGDKEKKAISEADTKPEANKRSTAKVMATMAPKEGAVTVTLSNKSANWHKYESGSKESSIS